MSEEDNNLNSESQLQEAQAQAEEAEFQGKSAETNEKLVKTGAKAVANYFAPGAGGQIVEAASKTKVGGAIINAGGQVISGVTEAIPGGRQLQEGLNTANDAGAIDQADQALSLAGGGTGGAASGAAGNAAGSIAGGVPGGASPGMNAGGAPQSPLPNQESSIDIEAGGNSSEMEIEMPEDFDMDEDDTQVDSRSDGPKEKDGLIKKGTKFVIESAIFSIIWKPVAIGMGIFFLLIILIAAVSPNMGAMQDLTSGGQGNEVLAAGMQNTYTSEQIEGMLVYVGDSRTVGLNYALNNTNIKFVAEPAIGYDWFLNTGKPELETYLTTNERKFVIINFGINDLHNIDRYINLYNGLISSYPSIQFYFMSVNPVDEALAAPNGYMVKNSDIQAFNNKLSEAFGDKYFNTYKSMQNYFSSTDGIHYDEKTYNRLHNIVLDFIKSNNKFSIGITEYPAANETEMLEGKSLLEAVGDSGIKEIEAYINSNVVQAGKCTGRGVAAAGASLIYGLHQQGFHLPYYWGGGHGGYVFVDQTWGARTTPRVSSGGNTYYYNGFDCSGFVTWTLRTANVNGGGTASKFLDFGSKISYEEAAPGDVLVNPGHIILVIENKGSYLQTAESTNGGVQFSQTTKEKISKDEYFIISMNDYYTRNCKG